MLCFTSDYIAGAHPDVLKALEKTNLENLPGYGDDKYCLSAKEKIKKAIANKDAEVFFLVGGTQTNQIVISRMLQPYEGVICPSSGHINVHEAGAIEYTSHKVIGLKSSEGKISAGEIRKYLETFYQDENHTHMVFPGMVYLSFPSEYGTIYSKAELKAVYDVCREFDIPLFIDGARLGYGLMSHQCDLTLKELASLCDVFYIGGTKVGALCGEAVVFTNKKAPKNFVTLIKQQGALLAKGRLLGVQFDALLSDDLYFRISKHAIDKAEELKKIFLDKGYSFFLDSPTNQQFIILDNKKMEELKNKAAFSFWEKYDESHTVVRFATSWSTTDEDIEELDKII